MNKTKLAALLLTLPIALAGCGKAPVAEHTLAVSEVAYDAFMDGLITGETAAPAQDKSMEEKLADARLDRAERILEAVFTKAE